MSTVNAIAKKELRTYFLSPIALMFIATFLLASLFSFFWVESFFSRGVADTRPLFTWLPVLLIFLVPALGMRLWSEEERMGTMELLRTFPLPVRSMVVGKFLSGLALIAVALLLTLPLPITVEMLGNLDWGPVFGGYLATLLLAAAYLAITLCISASTSSQIVALVYSALACGGLYLVGSEPVAAVFGNWGGEVLRSIGAGGRFESILRGVVDLRDLLYYVSLTVFFLALNVVILESRRWSRAKDRAGLRGNTRAALVLLGLNLVALNFVLAPVRAVRIDLTENNEYSISPVTEELLTELDEPLLIRGYFSGKTHPLLAPLVPRIRDMIEEYGAIGGDNVTAEFVDPTSDPELEKEAAQAYGIKSVPFQFADRHEASVVNSYFHVLVRYGDQYETLSFNDLIEVQVNGMDLNVRLRNLEYDLTRAIKKTVYGFQSIESIAARLPAPAKLVAVITAEALPPGFEDIATKVESVAKSIAERAGERFTYDIIDPDAPGAKMTREQVMAEYQIEPMAVSLFSDQTVFLHLLLQVGDRIEPILPAESMTEADIREAVMAALKRAGPGSLKTVGVFEGGPGDTPGMHGMPGGGLTFRVLRDYLSQTYQVESVDLADGRVPAEIDVLLVLDPRDLTQTQVYALDQFLMRGGSAIVATGPKVLDPSQRQSLTLQDTSSGLDQVLARYGVKVGKEVVLDTQSGAFPIPVTRNVGGFMLQEIQMLRYPAFVDVRGEGLSSSNPAVAGLPNVVMHWPAQVSLEDPSLPEGSNDKLGEGQVLLRTSPQAWTLSNFKAEPDFQQYPELGWRRGAGTEKTLAVTRMGPLVSFFADREPPALGGSHESEPGAEEETQDGKRPGAVIPRSPERTRLVVIGTANFASDFAVEMGRQFSEAFLANLQLVQNLVDWSLEDVELLQIRSRGTYARLLAPTEGATRQLYEWGNYLFALVAVGTLGGVFANRRKNAKPLALPKPAAAEPQTQEQKEGAA